MSKVLAYRHSKKVGEKQGEKEEVEIIDFKTERGVTTYTVKTQEGIKCSAIFNIFTCAYYADDVYGVIGRASQSGMDIG